ncbi:hypothetical protein ACQP6C_11505 [Snodgrassella alvi]|uniref:hypothetical protein n=1 Tax=Snodgrassella alvi TaxID=1196083 RepID=UPI003CFE7999
MAKDTVVVGCKLPNGLLLQVGEQVQRINGCNSSKIICGYGLTYNVPAAFWAKWLEENKDRDLVKNGLIFANANVSSAKDEAAEKKDNQSNMEPVDPSKEISVQPAGK